MRALAVIAVTMVVVVRMNGDGGCDSGSWWRQWLLVVVADRRHDHHHQQVAYVATAARLQRRCNVRLLGRRRCTSAVQRGKNMHGLAFTHSCKHTCNFACCWEPYLINLWLMHDPA